MTADESDTSAELYLELLKGCLTRTLFPDSPPALERAGMLRRGLFNPAFRRFLARRGVGLVERRNPDPSVRENGRDWPHDAETMIGRVRLDHLHGCIRTLLADGVPGDLIEAGVWRGGASILMRAALAAYAVRDRTVWLADSFRGLPRPDAERYPADAGDRLWEFDALAVPVETVKGNFERYGLLDEQVRFLAGWFKDTLPEAPIERLALARLDGDMYESTTDSLAALYPRLSVGGYLIVDDYGAVAACRQAVHDYRGAHGIDEPIEWIDWTGVFWRRARRDGS